MKIADHSQLIAAQTYGSMRPSADPRLGAKTFGLPETDAKPASGTLPGQDRGAGGQRAKQAEVSTSGQDAVFTPQRQLRAQADGLPSEKPPSGERPPRPGAFLDIRV